MSNGYIGLFADDARASWCVQGAGFYQIVMWVWCLPNDEGILCVDSEDFIIDFPSNIMMSTITYTPDWTIMGPPCCCLDKCWLDWNRLYHQTLYATDSSQSVIKIIPLTDDAVDFGSCEEGVPVYQGIVYTNLYINYDPSSPECMGTSVQSDAWGAIKELFIRE